MKAAFVLVTLVLATGAAAADSPAPAPRSEIPFANQGGIYDWRAEGDQAIVVESRDRHYFRASFLGPCLELKFRDRVGFVTDARDVLDKFQSVRVGDQTCNFISFDEIPKPEKW
jgi:Family of unknown function (DUF6491)